MTAPLKKFKRAVARWDGQCLWPQSGNVDALNNTAPGVLFAIEPYEKRSVPHNRRLMGAIKIAYDNWPQSHAFQPENFDHLRSWLCVKVGHCHTMTKEVDPSATEEAVRQSIDMDKEIVRRTDPSKYPFSKIVGNQIIMKIPKTTNFNDMPKSEFTPFSELVEIELEHVMKMNVDQLFEMKDAA